MPTPLRLANCVRKSDAIPQGRGEQTDWTRDEIAALFDLPFNELMFEAQSVHRAHHARGRGAAVHPAQHQDRRLPRGLRLLLAVEVMPTAG